MTSPVDRAAGEILGTIRDRGTYRRMRVLDGAQAPRMEVDGKDVWLFAGSNYLDLARHPRVVEAASRAARELGCAAGGSRLISGNLAIHEALDFLTKIGPAAEPLKEAPAAQRADAIAAMRAAFEEKNSADGVVMPSAIWLVEARIA